MKRSLIRFCRVALECATWLLPHLAAWVVWRLRS
jgi:hypothetical protein